MDSPIDLSRRKPAVLCYIFLAGSGYYFLNKYRADKFIRFHAYQSIMISILIIAVDLLYLIVIPLIPLPERLEIYMVLTGGPLIMLIVYLWIRSVFSAWIGKKYLLPFIGKGVQYLVDRERNHKR